MAVVSRHGLPPACALQVYTIYSILFIVFVILIIVTAFITIALTYFQLAVEDHRWAVSALQGLHCTA
jgi:hypothetical protein